MNCMHCQLHFAKKSTLARNCPQYALEAFKLGTSVSLVSQNGGSSRPLLKNSKLPRPVLQRGLCQTHTQRSLLWWLRRRVPPYWVHDDSWTHCGFALGQRICSRGNTGLSVSHTSIHLVAAGVFFYSPQHNADGSESESESDTLYVWNPNFQHEQQSHSLSQLFRTNFVQSWHMDATVFARTDIGLISLATWPI